MATKMKTVKVCGYGSNVVVPGGGDVYIINRDGTNMRVLTDEGSDSLVGWTNDSQHIIYYEGEPSSASGSYFAVNISNGTQTRLSGEVMDRMCSYWNCRNFAIRPCPPRSAQRDAPISQTAAQFPF